MKTFSSLVLFWIRPLDKTCIRTILFNREHDNLSVNERNSRKLRKTMAPIVRFVVNFIMSYREIDGILKQ